MARPHSYQPLPLSSRIIRWEWNGHHRGFFAQRRGQGIQCRIQGYNLCPRDWISESVVGLSWEVRQRIQYWGHPWRIVEPKQARQTWDAIGVAIKAGLL